MRQARQFQVLIVDDEPAICDVLAEVLQEGPDACACTVCATGADAYLTVRRRSFDVVLADVRMPGIDGLQLLELIRAAPAPRRRPEVVLVSGAGSTALARRALKSGAFDFVEKPFDLRGVRHIVHDAARSARREEQEGRPPPAALPSAADRDGLTGLPSHRLFLESLENRRERCRQQDDQLAIAVLDLDRLSDINENHSPALADRVLCLVAYVMRTVCRDTDLLSRQGGDRFVLALPGRDETGAKKVCARGRAALTTDALGVDGVQLSIGLSIGIAACDRGFLETPSHLIERANDALAAAKRDGGNRIVCWSDLARDPYRRTVADRTQVHEVARRLGQARRQMKCAYLESTRALVEAVEAKEPFTRRHALTVSYYCEMIARRLRVPVRQMEIIKTAALLHDVGKIGVPDTILQKPGPLTANEVDLIHRHPHVAMDILGHLGFLSDELPIVLHHHEWFDGTGYPQGLPGESIPFGARILAVADALDVMRSRRTYKESYDLARVRDELIRWAGRQFDPVVAAAAIEWLDTLSPPPPAGDDESNRLPTSPVTIPEAS